MTEATGLRILVCGGRDYSDYGRLSVALDRVMAHKPVALLIHGAARGADSLAGQWAKARGVPVQEFPADWATHGKAAGPIRNRQMLKEKPDWVIAFTGGAGTENMIHEAKAAGVRVWRV